MARKGQRVFLRNIHGLKEVVGRLEDEKRGKHEVSYTHPVTQKKIRVFVPHYYLQPMYAHMTPATS